MKKVHTVASLCRLFPFLFVVRSSPKLFFYVFIFSYVIVSTDMCPC